MTEGPPRPAAADEEAEEGGWGAAAAAEDGEADADGGAGGGPPLDPALAAINRADVRLGLLQVGRDGCCKGVGVARGRVRALSDAEILYGVLLRWCAANGVCGWGCCKWDTRAKGLVSSMVACLWWDGGSVWRRGL